MVSQRSKESGGEGRGEDGGAGEVHMPRFIVNVSAMEVCHVPVVCVLLFYHSLSVHCFVLLVLKKNVLTCPGSS